MRRLPIESWRAPCVCAALAAITFLVFGQTVRDGFINYDDNQYVYGNPLVIRGLALSGIAHVFTHFENRFYTPLTMVSHMADWQLYRSWAGGHHLTNVLLHAATAILLFLVLLKMTGALWRGAFVAAVFAVHPLHVESVAWVSERNGVLAGLFFMLTIAAYLHYVRQPRSPGRYLLVTGVFTLGLLAKPTLVALPFVLLLLDWWPLKRFAKTSGRDDAVSVSHLLLEKIPLLALAAAAGIVAYFAEGKSVASLQEYSIASRISNAIVSCAIYLRQLFWPSGLAIYYPRPANGLPGWEIACAFAVLASISAGAFLLRKRCPYLAMGWLWYLAMLAPVAGLVQVGEFAHADRYAYLSQIGLYLAFAWGIADLCAGLRLPRAATGAAGMALIGALIVCARAQASYWRDSESVFRHALGCTTGNYVACNNLGRALYENGNLDGAIAIYREGLGFREASAPLHDNLGQALFQKGGAQDMDEAIRQYERSLEIDPDSAPAHYNLGNALLQRGDPAGAIAQWRQCLEIQPQYSGAMTGIAWVLATCADDSIRNGPEAVELALRANEISGGADPIAMRTLAAAYAEAHRFPEAADTARHAAELAGVRGDTPLATELRREVTSYEAGMPLRAAAK